MELTYEIVIVVTETNANLLLFLQFSLSLLFKLPKNNSLIKRMGLSSSVCNRVLSHFHFLLNANSFKLI